MRVICDVEADALVPAEVKNLWIVCCLDYDTGKRYEFNVTDPNYIKKFRAFAKKVDMWIGHHFLVYDRQVIEHMTGVKIKVSQITDTLILSRIFQPVREQGHGLARWGRKFKDYKKDHNEWDRYSLAMRDRCWVDVKINKRLYTYLLNEGKRWSHKSIRIEHNFVHILEKARQYGWAMDEGKAIKLAQETAARAAELLNEIQAEFPPVPKEVRVIEPRYKKDGDLSSVGIKWLPGWQYLTAGPFTRIKWQEFNIKSSKQVRERMDLAGWKPFIFTKAGNPRIVEENLDTLPADAPPSAHLIKEYLLTNSRNAMANGWLDVLSPEKRIHGTIIHIGANTHRCSHRDPQTANIPGLVNRKGEVALYGEASRVCWTIFGDDRALVGVDAKGIQLRVLVHLMKQAGYQDPEFEDAVCNGKPHQLNADRIGIEYSQAKTFIYAFLLGGGHARLGSIVGGGAKEGKELKELFYKAIPGLRMVKKMLERWAKTGWMHMPDGRYIPLKNAHFAMGVALQGIETIVMRQAIILWYNWKMKRALDAHLVGFIHDETQADCLLTSAEESGILMIRGIQKAGKILNLNVPMDGDMKIGRTWVETH